MAVYPTPLTPSVITQVMQAATLLMLGQTQPFSPANYSFVRQAWQTQGQPFNSQPDDIIYVSCVEDDDPFDKLRDIDYAPNLPDSLVQLVTYTRVWRVTWSIYGPNSFENARKIRSGLYLQPNHDFLVAGTPTATPPINPPNLYLVTDVIAPERVPEFKDGQWWERVEFSAQFNEAVYETDTNTGVVTSVEVKVYTPDSPSINEPAIDVTIT